ncbi:MFS transporter [Bordetella genomosp. 9]|uniref:MFS transporter n=1 Tax=Bordetella genomosp. 9 TaxID=1416803 RepID=UPI000A28E142|nr:MFS transporter [Bordetella genomosp. 9]ARP90416.1 MFS transporter [Bordetella genomosp. 9]
MPSEPPAALSSPTLPPHGAQARSQWLALAVLLTGNFITILDLFIVNVAIPSIRAGLSATDADIQLVLVGYAAAYGVFLMNGARLGDLYGRKRLFLAGMGLFTLASAICGLATTPALLIAARVLQGLGSAALMPQVMASIRVLFDGDQRRRAFGAMGAVQGVAASISQLIGGALIGHAPDWLGWRLVFLINVPIGLAALAAGARWLVETRPAGRERPDLPGAALGGVAVALLLVPIMLGHEYAWPWWSWALPVLGVGVLATFLRYENRLLARGGTPMLDPGLFRNRPFAIGVAAIFLFYSSISSFFLSLTLLLQNGIGLSAWDAGLLFTPSAIAFFAASLAGPWLARRWGHYALMGGIALFAAGLAMSAAVALAAPRSAGWMIVSLILNGAGQGVAIPLGLNALIGKVGSGHAGMASGAVGTLQTLGTSFGITVVGVALFSLLNDNVQGDVLTMHGHAVARATLYNIGAALASLALFAVALRGDSRR